MKKCHKCLLVKPIIEFYTYRQDRCKQCHRERSREYSRVYYRNPENTAKIREKQRKYYPIWYQKNGRDRAVDYLDAIREWRKNNPEKVSAEEKLRYAVKTGKIIKPTKCMKCSREVYLVGHHPDYSKPLFALWLCGSCHKLEHQGKYTFLDK